MKIRKPSIAGRLGRRVTPQIPQVPQHATNSRRGWGALGAQIARCAMVTRTAPIALIALACATPAFSQIAVKNQGYIPYSDAPIFYRSDDINDPVAKLQKQLEQGQAKLVYDEKDHGYLKSVLKLLDVPVSSQTLVFSKTSFQYPRITPDHPRALYYNDDIYVGAVHEGKEIEIVSFDARQGAIFYLLHEQKADKPAFERAELDCTQCHIAAGTRGIPGVLIRSVQPTATGTLVTGASTFITDQESPFKERWGGWYVTGKLAEGTLANGVAADGAAGKLVPLSPVQKPFEPSAYLAPGSDAVALLVLGHQTQMHNLITLTNYKTRIALYNVANQTAGNAGSAGEAAAPLAAPRNTDAPPATAAPSAAAAAPPAPNAPLPEAVRRQFERPAEQLLRYLLFANETELPTGDASEAKALIASSAFAREFVARGPRDSKGRSLRDFDLSKRIFRYPCSYLIYNEAFDALPEPSKTYVYHRLLQILSGEDDDPDFESLSAEDRTAILEILLETKPGLPQEWQDYAHSHQLRLTNALDRRGQQSPQRGTRK